VKKKRATLTREERQLINTFLHTYYRRFWIFLQCFFHSGARETEMMRLKGRDIEISNKQIKYLVLKGNVYEEVYRPIKGIAVPFWEMALENCRLDDYVFAKGLEPGPVKYRRRRLPGAGHLT
jgi:hypothetical protein